MSPKIYHVSIDLILCLSMIQVMVLIRWCGYVTQWESTEWNCFYFTIRKQMLMFSCLGKEPSFDFPYSVTEPPHIWLEPCMFVCIAAISVSSFAHQFPCFLGINSFLWTWLSFCRPFCLSPWNLRGGFHKAFKLGVSVTKPHTSSTLLRVSGLDTAQARMQFTAVCCLRLWSFCIAVYHENSLCSLCSCCRLIIVGFPIAHDLSTQFLST